MSDVGKVSGGNRPEPKGPKKKKGADSEAFREMMKVGKVRETDPEEKRNRKRQAEAEEELKGKQDTSLPHQGLGAEGPSQPPPFEAGPGTESNAGGASTGPVSGPDLSAGEELPPISPNQQNQPQPSQPQNQDHHKKKKRVEESPKPHPTEKKKKKHKVEGKQPTKAPEKGGKAPLTTPPPHPLTQKEKEAVNKTLKEMTPPPKEEMPLPPVKKKEEKLVKEKQTPEEMSGPPPKVPPLPEGAWEATTDSTKEEKVGKNQEKELPIALTSEEAAALQQPGHVTPQGTTPTAPVAPLTAPFASLPAPFQQLFERMVGVITVMNTQGVKETTINLSNPQFAKSMFYGAQITITEFSTAPKAYNIELLGNQQAVTTMNNNAEELVAAFQAGNYTFKVHRIDAGYLPSTKEVKRKETQRVKRKKTGGG